MKTILIIGHARHGKDTVAGIMQESFGYNFESSSEAASRIFLFKALRDKYGYKSPKQCFEDRVNHRVEWHDLICEYNKDDKARLAKDILKTSNVYVGMRSDEELDECKRQKIFDVVLGVYAHDKPEESPDSFSINIWKQSDIIIPNSQGILELYIRVLKLKPIIV
jgi:dephospho-CoA kinase